jgi:replicative DNA helicase
MQEQIKNTEAELGVVGSVLLEPRASMAMCGTYGITSASFTDINLSNIFKACEEFSAKGKTQDIDPLVIGAHITGGKTIEWDVYGAMDAAIDATPTAHHCQHYCEIVHECELARRAVNAMETSSARLRASEAPVHSVLSDMLKDVIDLTKDVAAKKTPQQITAKIIEKCEASKSCGTSGLRSRWGSVSHILGDYNAPECVVVAARPSDGKTTFTLNECLHFARDLNVPVAIASMEMNVESIYSIMAGDDACVNMFKFRSGQWTEDEMHRLDGSLNRLQTLPIYVNDNRMTVGQLCSWITNVVAQHGVKVVAVDYLQLMRKSSAEAKANTVEVVGEWIASIKELGKRLNVLTIVLSQLNRGQERFKKETPPPPALDALRSSGEIEQTADVVLFLYKKPDMDTGIFTSDSDWCMETDVAKHREGPTGTKPMWFVRRRQRYMSECEYELFRKEERDAISANRGSVTSV